MLRGAFDMMYDFLGQWWFDAEDPLELETVPAMVAEAEDDDDGTPLPPPTGDDKPRCVSCGDPNFSLEGERCIACRIGMC
jgi:hypothetical protein